MIQPTIDLESEILNKGYANVCGVDEVGRGPWAGPVVVGVVCINNRDQFLEGVRDSKSMSEKKRDYFFELIKEKSHGWGIGIVENYDIDKLGLSNSIERAAELALEDLKKRISSDIGYLLIDGNINGFNNFKKELVNKGDSLHYSISAASVIAKVTRDNIMKEYSNIFPEYGFERNVGYGTKEHREALEAIGPCKIHRRSFKPIAKFDFD